MTTSKSPLGQLRAQADQIATLLKAAERGEKIEAQFARKIEEARTRESIKLGIVMDDKVLTPEIPWTVIRELGQAELSRWIVRQMRGEDARTLDA